MSTTANPPAKTKPKEKQLLSDNLGYCSLLQCSGHKNAQELPLKDIPLVSKRAAPQEAGNLCWTRLVLRNSCLVFSVHFCRRTTVPLLQTVYQADTEFMNFDIYILYSCYGITANCNAFPVAFGIMHHL